MPSRREASIILLSCAVIVVTVVLTDPSLLRAEYLVLLCRANVTNIVLDSE